MTFHVPNLYRVRKGAFGSADSNGNNGAFFIPNLAKARGYSTREFATVPLKVIASDGEGWEHVSISLPNRCPTWEEMCRIVSLFWDEDDCVMQLHPPRASWISNHPYCLHLWRPTAERIPLPPSFMVGYQELGNILQGSPEVKAEAQRRYLADNLAGPTGSAQ